MLGQPGGTVAACMWDLRGGLVFCRMFWDTAAMLDPNAVDLRSKSLSRPITRQGGIAGELGGLGLGGDRGHGCCFSGFLHSALGGRTPY